MAGEEKVEEAKAPEAGQGGEVAAAPVDPKVAAEAVLAEAHKLKEAAEQRHREASEALRISNERNRDSKAERAEARREAAEAKAAAEAAQRIARDMEAGMQVLAEADPDSPIARIVRGAVTPRNGNGRSAAPQDEETKRKLESLSEQLVETRRYIAGSQLREAHAAVDAEVESLWNSSHKPALEGVVDPKRFVAKVRKEVLIDPVINREGGVDEQTARARIAEITREVASEIEQFGVKYNERWKNNRRPETGAPTSRESAPAGPVAKEQKRVRYDPTKPGGWDAYKKAVGAET